MNLKTLIGALDKLSEQKGLVGLDEQEQIEFDALLALVRDLDVTDVSFTNGGKFIPMEGRGGAKDMRKNFKEWVAANPLLKTNVNPQAIYFSVANMITLIERVHITGTPHEYDRIEVMLGKATDGLRIMMMAVDKDGNRHFDKLGKAPVAGEEVLDEGKPCPPPAGGCPEDIA